MEKTIHSCDVCGKQVISNAELTCVRLYIDPKSLYFSEARKWDADMCPECCVKAGIELETSPRGDRRWKIPRNNEFSIFKKALEFMKKEVKPWI